MDPVELERLLDRELKQLPRPQAPGTLLPRVMAAAGQSAPWYRRPWVTWPSVWQVASAILLVSIVGGAALLVVVVRPAGGAMTSGVAVPVPQALIEMAQRLAGASALMRVVSEVFLQPVAMYVLVLSISLSVACGALWSALNRFAPGEASHQ